MNQSPKHRSNRWDLALVVTSAMLVPCAAAAEESWRLNDRFAGAHEPVDERSAEDLDYSLDLSKSLTSGNGFRPLGAGGGSLPYGPTYRSEFGYSTQPRLAGDKGTSFLKGYGLNLNGVPVLRNDQDGFGGRMPIQRIGDRELERPIFSFTIKKKF